MKELNKAVAEIRATMQSLWREGWGKEDPMSSTEIQNMDSWIQEHLDEVLSAWVKVKAAEALGITSFLRKEDD